MAFPSQTQSPFFRLPAELRNKITDHLLIVDIDIYLPGPIASVKKSQERYPGIQWLATCKQAYEEGWKTFWSMNVFMLPPGPGDAFKEYWTSRLNPLHKQKITQIGLDLSLDGPHSPTGDIPLQLDLDFSVEVKKAQRYMSQLWASKMYTLRTLGDKPDFILKFDDKRVTLRIKGLQYVANKLYACHLDNVLEQRPAFDLLNRSLNLLHFRMRWKAECECLKALHP